MTALPRRLRTVRQQAPQPFSRWQRFRASFYDKRPVLWSSLFAATLLLAIVLVDIIYFLKNGSANVFEAVQSTLLLLALQYNVLTQNDNSTSILLVLNVLFTVVFAQSIINSALRLFSRTDQRQHQLGLASTQRDHVIVAGLGRIGLRIASRLIAANVRTVVIERSWDSEFVARALRLNVPVVIGDGREPEILTQAGVTHARAVIACIDGDLMNLQIALAARRLCPDIRVIIRSFNEAFDRGAESIFGPHTAFSASALATPTIAAAVVYPNLEHTLPLDDVFSILHGEANPSASTLLGITQIAQTTDDIEQLERNHQVRVLYRGKGDDHKPVMTVLGPLSTLEALQARPPLRPSDKCDTYIICGLGKVGSRAVIMLYQRLTSQLTPRPRIVIVQRKEDNASYFSQMVRNACGDGVTFVTGDARDESVLIEAGIERALTVAAITSNDEINIKVALEARRLAPDVHIVLRVFSEALADELIDMFQIRTAYGTSRLASPTMAAATVLDGVSNGFFLDDRLYAMITFTPRQDEWLTGHTVADIRKGDNILVIAIKSGNRQDTLPPNDHVIIAGDEVIVVGEIGALRQIPRFAPPAIAVAR